MVRWMFQVDIYLRVHLSRPINSIWGWQRGEQFPTLTFFFFMVAAVFAVALPGVVIVTDIVAGAVIPNATKSIGFLLGAGAAMMDVGSPRLRGCRGGGFLHFAKCPQALA